MYLTFILINFTQQSSTFVYGVNETSWETLSEFNRLTVSGLCSHCVSSLVTPQKPPYEPQYNVMGIPLAADKQ